MAHFPRWVDEPTVDSGAMLCAYLQWSRGATFHELEDTVPFLWTVEHSPFLASPTSINGVRIPTKACNTVGCARCANKGGGFQFKWADRRWMPFYERIRREGSFSFKWDDSCMASCPP